MGSLAREDNLKKKMMSRIDTAVGMFLILKRSGAGGESNFASSKLTETSL